MDDFDDDDDDADEDVVVVDEVARLEGTIGVLAGATDEALAAKYGAKWAYTPFELLVALTETAVECADGCARCCAFLRRWLRMDRFEEFEENVTLLTRA